MEIDGMANLDKMGRFISFILRHHPETIGIELDEHGWANVEELLFGINNNGRIIDMELLEEIVRTDQKQRYSFNEDKTLIRANQGHSIPVNVELEEMQPPQVLYHGTASRFLDSIMQDGLKPMSRLYVHLSSSIETAKVVGARHGAPVILKINTSQMQEDGMKFYLSKNGVWLTNNIPTKYIEIMQK